MHTKTPKAIKSPVEVLNLPSLSSTAYKSKRYKRLFVVPIPTSQKDNNRFCITICLIFLKGDSVRLKPMKIIDSAQKNEILYYLPSQKDAFALSRFFAAFADGTRLRVLSALAIKKMCVSDIADVCGLNQTTVSHQLGLLKSQNIVSCERQGKIVFYALTDAKINQLLLFGVEFCG